MIIEPIVLLQQPHHSPRFLKDLDGVGWLQSATEVKGIFNFFFQANSLKTLESLKHIICTLFSICPPSLTALLPVVSPSSKMTFL